MNNFEEDSFLSISEPAQGEYKEKGSKFLSFAFPFNQENKLNPLIEKLRLIHPKARHYCYAYKIGLDNNRYRINDDGEPSGSAGKPIMGQISSHNLTNIIIIVIRYFGGTKLGIPGLIQAYKEASRNALLQAVIIQKYVTVKYSLNFDYNHMGNIMQALKDLDIVIENKVFEDNCTATVSIRLSEHKLMIQKFKSKVLNITMDEVREETEISYCKIILL